jgi:hypothetical protein
MTRGIYLAAYLGLAAFYYYFLGTGPTPSEIGELDWWRPRGWALRWEALSGLKAMTEGEGAIRSIPVLLFGLPVAAFVWAGLRLFQHALMRVAILGLGLTLGAFCYYGFLVTGVWRFFSWRWPAVTLSMSILTASLLFAPALVRWAAGLRLPGRVLAFLVPAVTIYLVSVEITGTDWELRANFSPWPVLTMFGLLVFGYIAAGVHGATGLGALIASRLGSRVRSVAIASSAVLGALATPLVFSNPGLRGAVILAALAAITTAVVLRRTADAEEAGAYGVFSVGAAAVVLCLIWFSDAAASRDFEIARNEVAPEIINALDAHYEAKEEYPDELEDLVPDYLAEIRKPEIGVIRHEGEEFLYINLGDSYNLEFAAGKWVQCAYSPAYSSAWGDDPNGEEAGAEVAEEIEIDETPDVASGPGSASETEEKEEVLEGSWSCEPTLPTLW